MKLMIVALLVALAIASTRAGVLTAAPLSAGWSSGLLASPYLGAPILKSHSLLASPLLSPYPYLGSPLLSSHGLYASSPLLSSHGLYASSPLLPSHGLYSSPLLGHSLW